MLKWWWLWQAFSLTHLPTPPMSVHSSPSRTHPWSVHSHHDFGFVFSSRTGFGAFLVSRRFSSSPPRVAEHPRTAIRVLPVSGASTGKNGFVFPHAGPPLSVLFLAGSDCLPTHKHSSVWGAHSELRAVLLHPRLTVKGHSRFWLSHRLIGSFSLL